MTDPFSRYQVFITPLLTNTVYGDLIDISEEVEITDFVAANGITSIKSEIDNGDYDFGTFTFGNISLKAVNRRGRFSDPVLDSRSLFPYTRNLCKVFVRFFDEDDNEFLQFRGIINDDATREKETDESVRFVVLSYDSVLRLTKVGSGAIASGVSASQAIKIILNVPSITSVLNYDVSNINVVHDFTIDDGEYFSAIPAKQALDELLVCTNSILYIDDDDNIIVRDRSENATTFNLYGHGDQFDRENIINIKNYNNGFQRAFSSIKFDEAEASNEAAIDMYGLRQKEISFDFITTGATKQALVDNLIEAFKAPKIEAEIDVLTKAVKGINLLDTVRVDFPFRYSPEGDEFLPLYGAAKWGNFSWPYEYGSIRIKDSIKFKVIMIDHNPSKMTTTLKVRQVGTDFNDGYF